MLNINMFVDSLIKPTLQKYGLYYSKLLTDWDIIIGKELSQYCWPKKISLAKDSKTKGVLHIEVANSSVNTEIYYQESLIIDRIASYFGYKIVTKLKVTVNSELPVTITTKVKKPEIIISDDLSNQLNQELDNLEDHDLKQAFYQLAIQIINKTDRVTL